MTSKLKFDFSLRGTVMDGITRLGALRDGLLVGISILYGLGFLVRSVYALQNDLGLLPAIDAQYFVAGMVPAIIILAAIILNGLVLRIVDHIFKWRNSMPETRAKRMVGPVLLATSTIICISLSVWFGWRADLTVPQQAYMSSLLFLLFFLFYSIVMSFAIATIGRKGRPNRIHGLWYPITYVAVGLVLYFISLVYPQIPQELGGVSPRCVYLDLDTEKLSEVSLPNLLGEQPFPSSKVVIQSMALELLYSSRDFLLVRSHGRLYEIDRAAVHAVAFCDSANGPSWLERLISLPGSHK